MIRSTSVPPTRREMERHRVREFALERSIWDDLMTAKEICEEYWPTVLGDLILAGELLAAGEGNLLVETRKPYQQTGSFPSVTLAATSKNLLPQNGHGFMTPGSYWDGGKEWRFTLMGQSTTGATPGNLTTELRYQAAVPLTDAGGTILATSAAVAMAATKTAISWVLMGRCHARSPVSSTAGTLFAWAFWMPDQVAVLIPAANTPQMIPAASAAAVNTLDTTLAGGLSVQVKRSGSTAETAQVHDLSVEAVT